MLRLFDQTVDVGVRQTGRDDACSRLSPSRDYFLLRFNHERYTLIGSDAATSQFSRDFSCRDLDHIGLRCH
jgi:hypothetical protein